MILNSKCFVNPFVLFLIFFYLQMSSAVIYNLNDTEYKKLPPIFHVDPYQECMQNSEGLYCTMELVLVSDEESPLLDVIREYSARYQTHYNHSLLRYNLCVSNTCKNVYDNTTTDLVENLEVCLNKTFQDSYGLKTRVLDNLHCKKANEKTKIEVADICMFALLLGILMLNIIGSMYDFFWTNGGKEEGINFLMYFAIRRNWRKLTAPAHGGPDARLNRLKGFSALKCITTILVIVVHSFVTALFDTENTKFLEDLFNNFGIQVISSGAIVVQTFFLVAGFLLAYNLELMSEKQTVNWLLFPKGIILRWIRLTPVYALVLFFTVTCNKYLVNGPFWYTAVMNEVEDCKLSWTEHLLYINNYNEFSVCMQHTWYLASDMQLYCLGLFVCIACRTPVCRKVVLSVLLVIALIIPVVTTYVLDLNGIMTASIEDGRHLLLRDRTFHSLYKPGHTNMFSYLAGMIVGLLAYHGQKINYDVQRLRKYRILYYLMGPLVFAMFIPGIVYYREGPRPSMSVRMLFAAYQKPVWSLFIGIGILGLIFKFENVVRGIVEWRGWTAPCRLSYCAYLVHLTIIRLLMGLKESNSHVTILMMTEQMIYILLMSYLVALPCWMLVEQPFRELMKRFLSPESKGPDTADAEKGVIIDPVNENKKHKTFDEQNNTSVTTTNT